MGFWDSVGHASGAVWDAATAPNRFMSEGAAAFYRNIGDLFQHDNAYARASDRQAPWNSERAGLYSENERLRNEFSGGYEPPSMPCEPFDYMDHPEIYRKAQQIDATSAEDAARNWKIIADEFHSAAEDMRNETMQIITSGWSGRAAGSAANGIGQYVAESGQLVVGVRLVANKLAEVKTGLDETKSMVPPPPGGVGGVFDDKSAGQIAGTLMGGLPLLGGLKKAYHDDQEGEAEARRVMTTIYQPVTVQTDQGVPVLPAAPQVVSNPATTGSGEGTTGLDSGGGGFHVPSVDSGHAGAGQPGSDPAGQGQAPAQGGNAQDDGTGMATHAASAGAGGMPDADDGLGSARAASAGGGSGGHGGGLGGSGAGVGGGGMLASPTLPGDGGAGGTGSGSAGLGRVVTSAGRTGAPGMGGTPRGKGKAEEDKEHKTAEYLYGEHNGEELLGDVNGRKVAPPVIGEWDEQGRPKW